MSIFTIPSLTGMKLDELRNVGKNLNAQRDAVLAEYKTVGQEVQEAIDKQEKIEIAERKAADPDYETKHQGIGTT